MAPIYGMSFIRRKKTKWRTAQPEGVGCPTPTSKEPIFAGHFRSSSEQIWKSILKEPKIICVELLALYPRRMGVGAEGLGEGWVVKMSQLKIMPIISCSKRLSICISIPFHRFGVFIHSIRRKKCNCNLYFPKY